MSMPFSRSRRAHADRDLDEELRSYVYALAEENARAGMSPDEALRAARIQFGGIEQVKEQVRDVHPGAWLGVALQDLRHGIRSLFKSPGFAITAFLTLALGIGASTAVFTLVDSVILKPLAYRDSERLVTLWERVPLFFPEPGGPNPRHADLWQKEATALDGVALMTHRVAGVALGTEHPLVVGLVISTASLFDVLQVTPLMGRTWTTEDTTKGHDNVAILSYSLWQKLFRGDRRVIGKFVRFGQVRREVIGILPKDFHFPDANSLSPFDTKQPLSGVLEPELFIPVALNLSNYSWNGGYGSWVALARLRPGVDIRQAQLQLNTIDAAILRNMSAQDRGDPRFELDAVVQPMQETVAGDSRTGLWLLMAAVLSLMFIACMNLANAQLGRSLSRQRETAMCAALGAAKWRLVWSALVENLLLAAGGGAAGVTLAAVALQLFRRWSPIDLPRLSEAHLNLTVLAFSVILIVGSSVLFGMFPALRMLRVDPQSSLQQSSCRMSGSRQSGRLRACLIALQVFGCTVLLLIIALLTNSLLNVLHQDRGFETKNIAVAEVRLGPEFKAGPLQDAALQNLRAIPGVRSAGSISKMPLEGETEIDSVQRADRPGLEILVNTRWVSPGYFETMGERLVAGRFIEERDRKLNSIVISRGLANALWPGRDPLGESIRMEAKTYTVTGVVADSHNTSLKTAAPRVVYLYYAENPTNTIVFSARATQSVAAVLPAMREAIWKYSPDITITRVKTLDSQVDDSLSRERFQTTVLTAFGLAALLVAMLGIYGVLSYSTETRRQEIGIRIALGATRPAIYGLTLGGATVPVMSGVAAGLIAAFLARRLIAAQLYGTQPVDLSAALIAVALFLAAALVAAFVPARRAASVDPMEALRTE